MAENSAEVEKPIESGDSTDSKSTEIKKGLSVVALVFGILGLVACWAPFFGLICCLVGVVLGIVALVKKNQKGMAIAGLVCGAIGIIPAALISIATGALVSIFGGVASELDEYSKDPINYCAKNPTSSLCVEDDDNDNDPKKTDTNNQNSSKSGSGWTTDYLKELADEEGIDYSELPQEYIDAFKDLEVCLDDAGIEINSWEEFENLGDNSDDLSLSQAMSLITCATALSEATEDIDFE